MSKTQHKQEHNNCIVEHSMLNGLQNNLKNAIEYAGAHVSKKDCLWEYPEPEPRARHFEPMPFPGPYPWFLLPQN